MSKSAKLNVGLDAMVLKEAQDLPIIQQQALQLSARDQETFLASVLNLIEEQGLPQLPSLVPHGKARR